MGACSASEEFLPAIPVLEFPGSEFPWRERLQPPLPPTVRRPVTEMRGFLDLGLDHARHDPAPRRARRPADHIDEFRLIGHGPLPSRMPRVKPTSLLPTA